jgi:hypothetical protein
MRNCLLGRKMVGARKYSPPPSSVSPATQGREGLVKDETIGKRFTLPPTIVGFCPCTNTSPVAGIFGFRISAI